MRTFFIPIILSGVFALVSIPAAAQSGGISATDVKITSSGEEVQLDMTLIVTRHAVTRLQSVSVVPSLSGSAGQRVEFPGVLVNGGNRSRIYNRHRKFGYTEIVQNPPLRVIDIERDHLEEKIPYSARVAGETWMDNADLNLNFLLSSPAGERQSYSVQISKVSVTAIQSEPTAVSPQPAVVQTQPAPVQAEPAVVQPQPTVVETQPQPTPVQPQAQPASQRQPAPVLSQPEVIQAQPAPAQTQPQSQPQSQPAHQPQSQQEPAPVRAQSQTQPAPQPQPQPTTVQAQPAVPAIMHTVSGTANLDFSGSSSALSTDFSRNPQELARVDETIRRITTDPTARIVSLTVTGYSSPGGQYETNSTLAYDRATALSGYLLNRHSLPASVAKIRAVGEDWNGLRTLVAESDLPYVEAILGVIDSVDSPDAKETRLRRMMGGQIWQRMEREIFPALQKVEYRIDYQTAQ